MNKLTSLCLLATLIGLSFPLLADESLPAQYLDQIVALQRRADKLAFGGIGSNNYHLAKARSWLDMAASEYHQVDTSGIIVAAITQAETLLTALENNQTNISTDMPSELPGSEKIRPDLWEKIAAIKNKNSACGQRQLAEGEIQLTWAGHEKMESGWSHAESYVRIAENSISEAQTAIRLCNAATSLVALPAPAPVATAPVAAAPVVAPPVAAVPVEKITLSGDALFDFGKSTLSRAAAPRLDDLAARIKQVRAYDEIVLVGHTDRLRSDGHPERNQKLSEDRAETIRQYLIGQGIPGDKMHASGAGSSQPIVECNDKPSNKSKAKLAACLQPNRRVEIIFHGIK